MSNIPVTLEIKRVGLPEKVIFAKDFNTLYEAYTAIVNFIEFYNSMLYDEKVKYRKPATSVVRDSLDKDGEWADTIGRDVHEYIIDLFLREEESNED